MMICGQSACSANKSIAVSSLTDDSIAPVFVAPIARDIANASSKAFPAPFCSTETKQGKPCPFTYKDRTEEPIILQNIFEHHLFVVISLDLPRSDHDDIACRRNFQKLIKHIIATSDNNCRAFLQLRRKLLVECSWLRLIGNKKEKNFVAGSAASIL